jgi:PAS domain S-box-containing protein
MSGEIGNAGSFFADLDGGGSTLDQYRRLVNTIDDGTYQLDADGRFVAVNDVIVDVTGHAREQLLGSHASLVLADEDVARVETAIRGLLNSDRDTATVDLSVRTADGTVVPCELRTSLLCSDGDFRGTVGVVRDVTDRKRSERALREREQQFRLLVDAVEEYAIFMLDTDGCVVTWNEGARRIKGYEKGEIVGEHVSAFYTDDDLASGVPDANLAAAAEEGSVEDEGWRVRSDGTWFWANVTITAIRDDEGALQGYAKVTRDMSERPRAEAERELREYETIVETMHDGVYVVDDGEFVMVNEAYAELTGYDREELLGSHISLVVDDEAIAAVRAGERELRDDPSERVSVEAEVQRADGDTVLAEATFALMPTDDGSFRRVGVARDVSERRQYEQTLRALNESSRAFLTAETSAEVGETVVDVATEVLDLPGVVLYRYDGDADRLIPDARSVTAGFMRDAFPEFPPDDSSITGLVYDAGEPRYSPDVLDSPHLHVDAADTEMRAGFFAPMGEYGILLVGDDRVDAFDQQTRQLVELLASNAEAAFEQVEHQRQLDRQRGRLAALNQLNDVVQDITDAVIDQSTREEIERTVCEALAGADSYEFAWIGEVDPHSQEVDVRTEAGVEGYLDGITVSVDPDDERSEGPTGRAVLTGELQTTRDARTDPRHDPWRETVREHGFRSAAAIPIAHEGTPYGVLNVYAARPDAFVGEEQSVIGQLGEVVGHAIASVERKHALLSHEVLELDFRFEDFFAQLAVPSSTDDRITLDQTVPIGDGDYLVYGTAPDVAVVESIVESVHHWAAVRAVDDTTARTRFEARLTEPPVLTMLASRGGDIKQATIADGHYQMTVQIPTSVDVRRVVSGVQDAYPGAVVQAQRQVSRTVDEGTRIASTFAEELTDRQRAVLEAAYYGGYFEWPRNRSGEEIAASLDISPATFSQHFRTAEKHVFEGLFESQTPG